MTSNSTSGKPCGMFLLQQSPAGKRKQTSSYSNTASTHSPLRAGTGGKRSHPTSTRTRKGMASLGTAMVKVSRPKLTATFSSYSTAVLPALWSTHNGAYSGGARHWTRLHPVENHPPKALVADLRSTVKSSTPCDIVMIFWTSRLP